MGLGEMGLGESRVRFTLLAMNVSVPVPFSIPVFTESLLTVIPYSKQFVTVVIVFFQPKHVPKPVFDRGSATESTGSLRRSPCRPKSAGEVNPSQSQLPSLRRLSGASTRGPVSTRAQGSKGY